MQTSTHVLAIILSNSEAGSEATLRRRGVGEKFDCEVTMIMIWLMLRMVPGLH